MPSERVYWPCSEGFLMFEELWSEIADAPGEIYDLPEMREFDDNYDDKSFATMLETSYDF
jgi:hypothetical protein